MLTTHATTPITHTTLEHAVQLPTVTLDGATWRSLLDEDVLAFLTLESLDWIFAQPEPEPVEPAYNGPSYAACHEYWQSGGVE